MANPAKEREVGELREVFQKSRSAVLGDFRGLTVEQMSELRNRARKASARVLVVKNRLARLAARGSQFEALVDDFQGPISVAFSYDSDVSPAKVATEFAEEQEAFEITAGMVQGKRLTPQEVKALADLAPREVLLARLLSDLGRPQADLVSLLSGIVRRLLYTMEAIWRAKETA